ncbi:unnamed protein product [Leptosia nina]|uniref:Uncharacterized protein n=1 Tax=Leptosia nina TaxID=320188 RepID=A0AAV1JQ08_9NEOP
MLLVVREPPRPSVQCRVANVRAPGAARTARRLQSSRRFFLICRHTICGGADTCVELGGGQRAVTAPSGEELWHRESWQTWTWQREAALSSTRWRLLEVAAVPSPPGQISSSNSLLHAALNSSNTRLAILAERAFLTVWERRPFVGRMRDEESCDCDEWRPMRSGTLSGARWGDGGSVAWAPSGDRLLVAGQMLLADRWEVVVLDPAIDCEGAGAVLCRSSCSAGTCPCWVNDWHFLTMHVRLLAPGHATTAVWLNSVAQATHSEHAGVLKLLLRVYNEAAANITHSIVAEVPTATERDDPQENVELRAAYYRCLRKRSGDEGRILVVCGGSREGVRGEARAALAWRLPEEVVVPPLRVSVPIVDRLRELRARRERQLEREEGAHLREEEVRSLCEPPFAECPLPGVALGVTLHPGGRCFWVSCSGGGVVCVSLPSLRVVQHLESPGTSLWSRFYRVQPHLNHDYVVSPRGDASGDVLVWSARSGRLAGTLRHDRPSIVALLPAPVTHSNCTKILCRSLLVLTTDALHVWHSRILM